MNATRPTNATILGILIALMIGTPAAAQSVWLGPDREAEVALEVLRPDFDGGDVTFFSSAVFLSGRYPLSDAVDVVAEIPITHFGVDGPSGADSETALGNPYLGVELGPHEGSTFGELGVRLPVAAEDNRGLSTGFLSDRDRWGAFLGDVLTIRGAVNYLHREPSGFRVRLHGGPSIWVYTGDDGGDSMELLADYGAHAWYAASAQVHLSAGVTGRIIVSEGDIDFVDRMINQFGLAVIGRFERVHPGLHVRIPFDFDGEPDETSYILGLSLAVPLAP